MSTMEYTFPTRDAALLAAGVISGRGGKITQVYTVNGEGRTRVIISLTTEIGLPNFWETFKDVCHKLGIEYRELR